MSNVNLKTIERFSLQIRIAHWVNALCIFMLLITGLPLYTDFFNFIFNIFGGSQNTKLLHRIFAVLFLLPTLFIILTDRAGFRNWTSQITHWKDYDFKYFMAFPKELLGMEADMPPQGFFNGGQKLNSVLTIFAGGIMIFSGFLLWFHDSFPQWLVLWAFPMHDLGVALMIPVVIGHIYLSVGNKTSRPSILGMTKGYVDADYAKSFHRRWYDEVMKRFK